MFDINTIVNAAIHDAVQEAMKGHITNNIVLATRCTALERELDTLLQRVATLEGVDHERSHALNARYLGGAMEAISGLEARVKALEAKPLEQALVDEKAVVEALNSQEWFWEKLTRKAKEVADAAVEEAIDDHCSNYDHDDYDRTVSKVDDLDDSSGLESAIKDVLDNVSFDVRINF